MSGEEPLLTVVSVKHVSFREHPQAPATSSSGEMTLFDPGPSDAEDPSLLTKAQRLRRELTSWVKAGAHMATRANRIARLKVCASCEYFDPSGNWGLGQCRAPGCGCTKDKAYLATSKCPKDKWAA